MAATRSPPFNGRGRECQALDQALAGARGGESAVLVIRGEAGIGKTALLHHCALQASDCRVVQIAGVEAEMEMPFAGLHQLCWPMLGDVAGLPAPQEQALQVAFGLAAGSTPDRFLVGLAVLSLLAEVATKRPLVCLVDDAQWLDDATSQVLAFVGRRLLAEAVVLLVAVRETADARLFSALPALTLDGLADDDAWALLTSVVSRQLDERVRDRIISETRGNPLALLEVVGTMSDAESSGGFAVPITAIVPGDLEDHYVRRVQALPPPTQRLLVLAASDPTGDPVLLWRAMQALGIGRDAAAVADSEQLLEIGSRVRFRHPLVRSAAYRAATLEDRCAAHLALAAATDANIDPERRVWHLAAAATRPDEALATELELTANTANARAGLAGAAAFLERSAQLTPQPERRADRALAAARAHVHAGMFEPALALLAEAAGAAVNDLQRANAERLKGQIQWASNPGREAPVLLLQAAARLEPLDVPLARETYLEAWMASYVAGRLAEPGGHLPEVSRAARSAPQPPQAPRPCDLFLDGLATIVTDGLAAAEPRLRAAVNAFLADPPADEWLQWGHLATHAAVELQDVDSWAALSARHIEVARASGALTPLSIALSGRGMFATWCGDFETASALMAEERALKEAAGIRMYAPTSLLLAAYQGRPAEASPLIAAAVVDSEARGEGQGVAVANGSNAILHNGISRYAEALAAAEQAADELYYTNIAGRALAELVEAAVRAGQTDVANDALRRLGAATNINGSDWASGIAARSRALVNEGEIAEQGYADAIERLGRTPFRTEVARARLVYGEWLRREGRRVDAREQLRAAFDMFTAMGAEGFAERARRELLATGEKVRKRQLATRSDLTPQEEHIARLARDGRTNREIAAELFISAHTVEWHLGKVFTKLGITSRRGLSDALPTRGR